MVVMDISTIPSVDLTIFTTEMISLNQQVYHILNGEHLMLITIHG